MSLIKSSIDSAGGYNKSYLSLVVVAITELEEEEIEFLNPLSVMLPKIRILNPSHVLMVEVSELNSGTTVGGAMRV